MFAKSIKTIRNFTISNSVQGSFPLNIGAHSFQNDHSQSNLTIFLFLHSRTSVTNDSIFCVVSSCFFTFVSTIHLPRKSSKRAGTCGYCVWRRQCVRSAAARVAKCQIRVLRNCESEQPTTKIYVGHE